MIRRNDAGNLSSSYVIKDYISKVEIFVTDSYCNYFALYYQICNKFFNSNKRWQIRISMYTCDTDYLIIQLLGN